MPISLRYLARAKEQTIRLAPASVMLQVGRPNIRKEGDLREARDRQAAVDQAVVDDHISDAEQRHSNAGAKRDFTEYAGRAEAAVQNQCNRNGSVERREDVIALESAGSPPVVGPMNTPERMVPNTPVKERRPELHGRAHPKGHRYPNRDRHHALPSTMLTRGPAVRPGLQNKNP